MALRPPPDFHPPLEPAEEPSVEALRDFWERRERGRAERQRAAEWRLLLEGARCSREGELVTAAEASPLPGYVADPAALGPGARAALRPVPPSGRALAAGVDTWSPCWYAEPASSLARALRALAGEHSRHADLLPEPVGPYRVGWFPDSGLAFAEGRLGAGALLPAAELAAARERLHGALRDLGIPVAAVPCAGLRRLDVAADLLTDSGPEGLALLEAAAAAPVGAEKLVGYRAQHCLETVLLQSRGGRVLARLYDKGAETSAAPRGRWLRFEAQWRFPRGSRPACAALTPAFLRSRFKRRLAPFWAAAGGQQLGGAAHLAARLGTAVEGGRLAPSRARSLAGYLLLAGAGVPQGAGRTTSELERECRELGISASPLSRPGDEVDLASTIDECLAGELWTRSPTQGPTKMPLERAT